MRAKEIEKLKNDGIDALHRLISSYVEISDDEWKYCLSRFSSAYYPKKAVLLDHNELCNKIFFTAGGLLRIYFSDESGEEKTFHFCMEHTFAADYESFLKNMPSNFSIQALEDSVVIVITLEMLQSLYRTLRHGEKLGRLITEDYFFMLNEKIKAFYMHSPMESYKKMNLQFPGLIQRVPQYYIASYLNISPVHLSRLKYALEKK
ncbi:Crp/Fnr family transcriptional regulator [Flavobacterium procerum]|uniref:Crp/Fnr family transcriptional regulator n=1 Tax=Flavobacterium procerum TaxID=1455569 RepID=A0ABV6BS77_9FLAO